MRSLRATVDALLLAVLAALLAACATGPEGADSGRPSGPSRGGRGMGPGQMGHEEGWKVYDLNGDGRISRAEFWAVRNSCFVRYDANEDGALTRNELRRAFPANQAERLEALFLRMDRDGDGQITREEFDRESEALFRFLDTNGDGVIAGLEIVNMGAVLSSDICRPSSPPEAGDGRRGGGPPGGPGPRSR